MMCVWQFVCQIVNKLLWKLYEMWSPKQNHIFFIFLFLADIFLRSCFSRFFVSLILYKPHHYIRKWRKQTEKHNTYFHKISKYIYLLQKQAINIFNGFFFIWKHQHIKSCEWVIIGIDFVSYQYCIIWFFSYKV